MAHGDRRKTRLLAGSRGRFYVVVPEGETIHGRRAIRYKATAQVIGALYRGCSSKDWAVHKVSSRHATSTDTLRSLTG